MMLPAHVGGLDDALFYLRRWPVASGHRLAARAAIDAQLRPVRYAFNYLEVDGAHLWAFHYHPGHEGLGGWAHTSHQGDASQVHPASVVTFDELLERIHRR